MKTNKLIKFALNLVTAFLVTVILASAFGANDPAKSAMQVVTIVALVQLVFIALGFKSKAPAAAYMSLLTEVWAQTIEENLYQNNAFMAKATDHSMWISHKTVHIPQAGAIPDVEQNRTVLPAPIGSRVDSELTYNLNQYTAAPIVIQKVEELQISYPKRLSILKNYIEQLGFVVSTQTLYSWAPSGLGSQVQTTGSAVATTLPNSTATGTRKAIQLVDIAKAKAILDNQNIPAEGRVLLMNSNEYNYNFLAISNIQSYYAYGAANLPEGVVGRIFGFEIMVRPDVLQYDSSSTAIIKAINGDGSLTTPATTDCGACLAFHPAFVARALGSITPYYQPNLPQYYGDLFSAEVMHGSSLLRTDAKGVVAIVQNWVS